MKLEPIEERNVVDRVTTAIMSMIVDNGLKSGDLLPPQAEFIKQLRVSRVSVREAIQRLVAFGIVKVQRGKRMIVGDAIQPPFAADKDSMESYLHQRSLYEIAEVRSIIEPDLAALAAERASEEKLEELGAILEQMQNTRDFEIALELNSNFHNKLAEATNNHAIIVLMRSLHISSSGFYRYLYHRLYDKAQAIDEYSQHYDIYIAVKNGNADKSRHLMRQHIKTGLVKEIKDAFE